MFTHSTHNSSALTPDISTWGAVSQYMGNKKKNWHNLFDKVTQIFPSKLKVMCYFTSYLKK